MNQQFRIVGIGEILWDVFPEGPRFGGAPANFACHAAAIAGAAVMVSGVGQDSFGQQAIATLRRQNVATEQVAQLRDFPTGTVTVEVDPQGKPTYRFGTDEAWDHLEWSTGLAELAARADAVCFGTLGQRNPTSRRTIQRFVAATRREALRIFDINLRAHFFDDEVIRQSLAMANVLKLNDEELPVLARVCSLAGEPAELLAELARRFELPAVALTRGAHGALLLRGEEINDCPGVPVVVKDTVGAGDAFTAAMTWGLLRGEPLGAINHRACEIAAFVCSQSGATPSLPSELLPNSDCGGSKSTGPEQGK
jgi:fructokinase